MSKANQFPIPRRYTDESKLAGCDPRAGEFVRKWDGASGGALLGPTKAGKSLAAGIACQRLTATQTPTWVRWVRADYLTRMISERNAGDQIHDLKMSRVLVIDELGYEPWPTTLLEVLGDRHDNERPTIITSGLTESAFADRYSDATLRRILEIGNGLIVDFWAKKQLAVAR